MKYKLDDKWYESYYIREINEIEYYYLMKMNEVELKENYADNWLKKFFFYEKLNINRLKYHESIWICGNLDLLKLENEIETDEEESKVFDMIEVIF